MGRQCCQRGGKLFGHRIDWLQAIDDVEESP
jgi:hypothetical protein